MVRIYCGEERAEYPLAEIQSLAARDLIERITKKPADEYSYLSISGDRLSASDLISSIEDLDEDDVMRVVFTERPHPVRPFSKSKIGDCRKMLKKLNSSHMVYAISSLMETMFDPDFLKNQIESMPELRMDSESCQVLCDYFLMSGYITENSEQSNAWLAAHPNFLEAAHRLLSKHLSNVPRNSSFMRQNQEMMQQQQRVQQAAQAAPLISAEQLQAAMRAAFGPIGAGPASAVNPLAPAQAPVQPPAPATAPSQAPQHVREVVDNMERFSAQLAQLREFGFTDDIQNVTILESTDGNVELALELLCTMREDDM